ncbi:MAG: RHS repeat-associated core domain-containing protein [Thermoanaerobaculia bacterium]
MKGAGTRATSVSLLYRFHRWRLAYGHGWAPVAMKRAAVTLFAGVFLFETSVPAQASCFVPLETYEILFYAADHLGSTNLVLSSSGTVLEKSDYLPFGQTLSRTGSLNQRYKFNGKERDVETGFSYYGARYYDSSMGRFLSPDPFVQDPYDGQSFNRYSYVRNNPLNRIDPTGNIDWCFGLCGSDEPGDDIPGGLPGDGGGGPPDDPGGGDPGRTIYSSAGGEREKKHEPPPPDPPVSDTGWRRDAALLAGSTAAQLVIPGVGEAFDFKTLFDSGEKWYWRVAAGGSLAVSLVTLGATPNVTTGLRAYRSANRIADGAKAARGALRGAANPRIGTCQRF